MSNSLEIKNLGKAYTGFSLEDVSFSLPKGYIMGFIGPNGAGKTTTIKCVLDMVRYDAGEIELFGKTGAPASGEIGVVMDAPFFVDEWTMKDVEAAVAPFYPQWSKETYAGYLKDFAIDMKKKVKELSRGMKVKLMLAVALSHNARLLILDEPTSGLDPVAREELCDALAAFVTDPEKSVLFSTHITSDLEKIADYITFILNGKILFSGPKDDLMERYMLVKGGLNDLTIDARKRLIGLREYANGFEAMAEVSNIRELPKGLLTEPVTLEEIIVFINKGAKEHV